MKIIKVAANSSQMSLPWCDIFPKEGSTKTVLEQLSNSENHTLTGQDAKINFPIFWRLAFQHSVAA